MAEHNLMPQAQERNAAILAGALSTILFFMIAYLNLGLLLLLPSLPLFAIGLRSSLDSLLKASGVACLGVLLFSASLNVALLYIAIIATSVLLFAPRALVRQNGVWYPVGLLLTDLAVYTALITLFMEFSTPGGLEKSLIGEMQEVAGAFESGFREQLLAFAAHGGFLAIGFNAFAWCLLVYLHAWMANQFLKSRKSAMRESLELEPFTMPLWMLFLLLAASIMTLSGGDYAFISRALLLIFLLPYFFLGVSIARLKLGELPARKLWLIMMYVMIAVMGWPFFAFAGAGIWHQCRRLFANP